MKHITFYLDFISPYAYLAFDALPRALVGVSHSVRYEPVLLGALLQHHGQVSGVAPAARRAWAMRHTAWLAHESGLALHWPASHPFNPLPLLRLAWASAAAHAMPSPSRHTCQRIFEHVWQGGSEPPATAAFHEPLDAAGLEALTEVVTPTELLTGERVAGHRTDIKARLRQATDDAIARGVFGVPMFEVDGQLFWGLDALPMLRAHLLAVVEMPEHA